MTTDDARSTKHVARRTLANGNSSPWAYGSGELITAYLEEKIWSFFKRGNLTSGNKIFWIRGEIAHKEHFLPFSTIFSVYIFNVRTHITYLWNLIVRFVFSSVLHIWYVEVRISQSVSEGPFDFEITRVDCMSFYPVEIAVNVCCALSYLHFSLRSPGSSVG